MFLWTKVTLSPFIICDYVCISVNCIYNLTCVHLCAYVYLCFLIHDNFRRIHSLRIASCFIERTPPLGQNPV